MSELLGTVDRTIRTRRLFGPGQGILVAVSGGVDSMVLLHVLHGLAARHGWRLTVAHLNHQLRGRSSAADERLVCRTAQKLELPVVIERSEVRRLSRAQKLSLEMAARELRHGFLARVARQRRIRSIALAHHADDQLELFFLRLLRGSGGEGLAGMKWRTPSPADRHVGLVRPLLDQPKAVLIKYAAEHGIPYREDESNAALGFQRNRIRHELLPLLRRRYRPGLDRTIARVMEIVGGEAEFAAEAAREWLAGMQSPKPELRSPKEGRRAKAEGERAAWQRRLPFDRLPLAVQRRCVQLQLLAQGVVPDYALVEQLRLSADWPVAVGEVHHENEAKVRSGGELVEWYQVRSRRQNRDSLKTAETPTLLCALRDRLGFVHLRGTEEVEFNDASTEAELKGRAGEVEFDGARIRWGIQSRGALPRPAARAGREYFDADQVGSPVRLRHWQPGDRFQPIGMASTVKLQDFFTNQKVPRKRRRQLIVAETTKGEVFWVEGMRISEQFKLTMRTIRRLHWRWERP